LRPRRLLDVPTAEKFSHLHNHALDRGMAIDVNFDALREPKYAWLVQLFDPQERIVVTGRGKDLPTAMSEAHDRWHSLNPSERE
jgi:hypothetical protein